MMINNKTTSLLVFSNITIIALLLLTPGSVQKFGKLKSSVYSYKKTIAIEQPMPAIVLWSDNFDNNCASNCLATTWNGWTILDNDGGTTGGDPNNWYVSCAEEGIVPPGCGSSCIGDESLHIGANPGAGGDQGASFNETGAANATYRTAVSPTINLSGNTTYTLYFDFIAYGSAGCSDDRAQLRLSVDNGATWPVGFQYCLTSLCCGACNGYSQGQWTTYSLALPAAFNNNPNVRVGFNWRNNGNGSGTDPSVAIDDIMIVKNTNCTAPFIYEYNSNCYSSMNDALTAAGNNGGTILLNSNATISGNVTIPGNLTFEVNAGISCTITGTFCNNGTIVNNGTFTNQGSYRGIGSVQGNFINHSLGSVSPGSCN